MHVLGVFEWAVHGERAKRFSNGQARPSLPDP
jgi:hypothetical protein